MIKPGLVALFSLLGVASAVGQSRPPSVLDELGGAPRNPPSAVSGPPAPGARPDRVAPSVPAAPVPQPPPSTAPPPTAGAQPPPARPPAVDLSGSDAIDLPPPTPRRRAPRIVGKPVDEPGLPVAAAGQIAPGVVVFELKDGQPETLQLRLQAFKLTTVFLPPCETANDIYVGDSAILKAGRQRRNVLNLWAVPEQAEAQAKTNLTVLGSSGQVYSFFIRTDGDREDLADFQVYVKAAFLCGDRVGLAPEETSRATDRPGERVGQDFLRHTSVSIDRLEFDGYEIFIEKPADAEIAPERVFSDGLHLYLDYGEKSDRARRAAVFLLSDLSDEPLNTHVVGTRNQILRIDNAAGKSVSLKSGQALVCIRPVRARGFDVPARARVDQKLGR